MLGLVKRENLENELSGDFKVKSIPMKSLEPLQKALEWGYLFFCNGLSNILSIKKWIVDGSSDQNESI